VAKEVKKKNFGLMDYSFRPVGGFNVFQKSIKVLSYTEKIDFNGKRVMFTDLNRRCVVKEKTAKYNFFWLDVCSEFNSTTFFCVCLNFF
jgi:hypothetical protein